ncbi:CheY-like chemotaxis protein [Desulfobaculum xiamenense]|uniref:CheY-like chemotaxis protein n=1 Tax=Desulfobaculum xiamenense TaxID=995050 RepID=A0A846QV19_9BACT|nr:response regulator [Desulfobaculum xiamenense]NJB69395.1 CheY-like chemotaxis protein [Desulfobaculum xiamenense]
MHILLVEDECITRESARLSLEDRGYTVTAVENGKRAIEALCAHPCDLVLMDIKMPVMDGMEAARKIRSELTCGTAIPIIALTAYNSRDFDDYRAAGFTDWIEKPYNSNDLVRKIRELT